MKLQSVQVSISKNSVKLTFHSKTSPLTSLRVFFLGSNNDDPILVYCFNLPLNSTNSQWHLAVPHWNKNYINYFVNKKKIP